MAHRVVLCLFAAAVSGCTGTDSAELRLQMHAYVASSMQPAMRDAAALYEANQPDVEIVVVAAGSQVLARQIRSGAEADLFISASAAHADSLDGFDEPEPLVSNELVLLVLRGSSITRFEDLDRAEHIVVGVPEVPVGAHAARLLEAAGQSLGEPWQHRVEARIASYELNARQVALRVALGEADAAIGYRTAAVRSDALRAVPLPEELAVSADYVLTRPNDARTEAVDFEGWLTTPAAIDVFIEHGFVAASEANQ